MLHIKSKAFLIKNQPLIPACPVSSTDPLYRNRFIRTVISRVPVKLQCFSFSGTCEQHHLITIFLYRNVFRIIQTFCGISLSPVISMSHNIFHKSVRPYIPCQIRDDHANTGGNDPAIHYLYDQMVVLDRKSVV